MENIEDMLTIEKCYCGRPWCNYFSGAIGESGTSFSEKEIKEMLENIERNHNKVIKHLKKLLLDKK